MKSLTLAQNDPEIKRELIQILGRLEK